MGWKIPLFKIYWGKEDVQMVSDTIKKGMYWATGPNVEKFEEAVSKYVGTKYVTVFNSGTSALHAALLAHGIKRGDEVIVPSFTFIATANSPLFVGATPVFAEIEDKTYGIDPDDVKEKITKKTRAIIPIHYGGCSCLIRELKEIAQDHDLILIEDAAESLGAAIKEKKVGTFGDSAMFSFCAPKVITTGEGGVVVTNSRDVYEKLKLIRSHGRVETADYFSSAEYMNYITLGYNFRMSNITAALGIAQIRKIDKIIKMRRRNAEYLSKKLSKITEVTLPDSPADYFHIYQMYTVKTSREKVRDELAKYLSKEGIMTKVYFSPVHLTRFYKKEFGCRKGMLPNTERIAGQVLTLPMYPELTRGEMDYITEKVYAFFRPS